MIPLLPNKEKSKTKSHGNCIKLRGFCFLFMRKKGEEFFLKHLLYRPLQTVLDLLKKACKRTLMKISKLIFKKKKWKWTFKKPFFLLRYIFFDNFSGFPHFRTIQYAMSCLLIVCLIKVWSEMKPFWFQYHDVFTAELRSLM